MLQAEYLLGLRNAGADWHSRPFQDINDWTLGPGVFGTLSTLWGPFQVDLFVAQMNVQVVCCFSWHPATKVKDTFLLVLERGVTVSIPVIFHASTDLASDLDSTG